MTGQPTTNKELAAIYRKAAEEVARQAAKRDYHEPIRACWAIEQVQGLPRCFGSYAREQYQSFMLDDVSMTALLYPNYMDSQRAHDERVMSLLLMAEVVLSNDDRDGVKREGK